MGELRVMAQLAGNSIARLFARTTRDLEESEQRFILLGLRGEYLTRVTNLCNAHRTTFQFDQVLAQMCAQGYADHSGILSLFVCGPTAFKNFEQTRTKAALGRQFEFYEFLRELRD